MGGSRRAIVVASGATLTDAARAGLAADDAIVIAADGGVDAARALGLHVNVAVGDFDSASEVGLAWARDAGAVIDAHPEAKDATDLELALHEAERQGAGEILVLASDGGRLDHLLANATALTPLAERGITVSAWFGPARLYVGTPDLPVTVDGAPGDLVTLIPLHGRVEGVRTSGLAYPLADEPLDTGTSRGVSNVLIDRHASIHLTTGTLLVVLPGASDHRRPG